VCIPCCVEWDFDIYRNARYYNNNRNGRYIVALILYFDTRRARVFSCNYYKLDQLYAHKYNVLIYKTPTYFGFHWPIIRACSCTILSLGHIIICNVRNCGEIINAWFMDASMYTVRGAAYSLEYVHGTKVISFRFRPFCRRYRRKRRLYGPHMGVLEKG
jgi:hypothetical protein